MVPHGRWQGCCSKVAAAVERDDRLIGHTSAVRTEKWPGEQLCPLLRKFSHDETSLHH